MGLIDVPSLWEPEKLRSNSISLLIFYWRTEKNTIVKYSPLVIQETIGTPQDCWADFDIVHSWCAPHLAENPCWTKYDLGRKSDPLYIVIHLLYTATFNPLEHPQLSKVVEIRKYFFGVENSSKTPIVKLCPSLPASIWGPSTAEGSKRPHVWTGHTSGCCESGAP